MAQTNYTPSQKMAMFNQATRQNMHMLPTVSCAGGAQTLSMLMPKSRLLAKILLKVEARIASKGNETTVRVNPNKIISRFSLDLNNGFSPFVISGEELHVYNMLSIHAKAFDSLASNDVTVKCGTTQTEDTVTMYYELPLTLNDRDPQGLILLQNAETNVQLSASIGMGNDILIGNNNGVKTGFTVELKEVKISGCTVTYSIPAVSEAFPDLSVLKLTNGVAHSFLGSGVNTVKLSTGTIYRKLILMFEDEDGKPLKPSDFTSDIQLVFNQADINYSISAEMLRDVNNIELDTAMPDGVYVLDFSSQGFTNFGGTRDLIDTELLTEFWVKFGTTKRGKVSIVSECIARVR